MPKFTLVINLGNEGEFTPSELADLVLKTSQRVRRELPSYTKMPPNGAKALIRDINGNVVGHYEVV